MFKTSNYQLIAGIYSGIGEDEDEYGRVSRQRKARKKAQKTRPSGGGRTSTPTSSRGGGEASSPRGGGGRTPRSGGAGKGDGGRAKVIAEHGKATPEALVGLYQKCAAKYGESSSQCSKIRAHLYKLQIQMGRAAGLHATSLTASDPTAAGLIVSSLQTGLQLNPDRVRSGMGGKGGNYASRQEGSGPKGGGSGGQGDRRKAIIEKHGRATPEGVQDLYQKCVDANGESDPKCIKTKERLARLLQKAQSNPWPWRSKEEKLERRKARFSKTQARYRDACGDGQGNLRASLFCNLRRRKLKRISNRIEKLSGKVDSQDGIARLNGHEHCGGGPRGADRWGGDWGPIGDVGDGYGALSKRKRRDKRLRQAQRKLDRYKKCVQKKGEDNARCQRILSRADKKILKAKALEDKLKAKGKTTTAEALKIKIPVSSAVKAPSFISTVASQVASDSYSEEYPETGLEEMDYEVEEEVDNTPMIIGGVALAGVAGFLIYQVAKQPKKKKRSPLDLPPRSPRA